MKNELTILPDRLERFLKPDQHLVSGIGKGPNGELDLCIMQAINWLRDGDFTSDAPPCVSPAIRAFCIRLNDSYLFKDHRDLLKPYAVKMVGTAGDGKEQKRGFIAANFACRIAAPIYFKVLDKAEWAKQCKALKPITNKATAMAANALLREITTASSASAAAVAASYAEDAAVAASYASYAEDAAYAAAAYAYAADADAAARREIIMDGPSGEKLRKACLKCLSDLMLAK